MATAAGAAGAAITLATSRLELGVNPLGAALFAGSCGLVVGGAVRAKTRAWSAALCAIGALPAGFVGAMAAGGVDDFRSMYLRSVLFVASQAMVAMQAWHGGGRRLDRVLGVIGLWASWLGVAGHALGASSWVRGAALVVGALTLGVGLARAADHKELIAEGDPQERTPLTYRDGRFEDGPAFVLAPSRALLWRRLGELGTAGLGGGLAAAASLIVAVVAWGLVSGVGQR
jgi:hypothetical protein